MYNCISIDPLTHQDYWKVWRNLPCTWSGCNLSGIASHCTVHFIPVCYSNTYFDCKLHSDGQPLGGLYTYILEDFPWTFRCLNESFIMFESQALCLIKNLWFLLRYSVWFLSCIWRILPQLRSIELNVYHNHIFLKLSVPHQWLVVRKNPPLSEYFCHVLFD